MARGLVSGVAAGTVVAVVALGGASVMLPVPHLGAGTGPAARGPDQAVSLPETSEFARDGVEALPAVPPAAAAPTPDEPAAPPSAPPPGAGAETAPQPATEPPARPETEATAPTAPVPPQTAGAALETAPEAEPAMPVPPPGEAVAPDLPPPDLPRADLPGSGKSPVPQEITLMPDGAIVPASPALPGVIVPGTGAGFADAPGIKVNRMPQIGTAPPSTETSVLAPKADAAPTLPQITPGTAPAAPSTEASDQGPALERFAAAYIGKPEKPWLSVLLVDVGTQAGGLDRETIKALGPSVTVALDPAAADATEAAAFYRAAGLEVVMLADALPAGATPQDVEVAFAAWHSALPQAVALVEPETPVLQGTARLAGQAEKALAAEGMAYVTQSGGIGAKAGAKAAVPRASIWRVLDAKRDKAPLITRTLARAAFEAGKEGSVVVMLHAWPESVAGLGAWSAEEGAKFNLAPLSALLNAKGMK